MSAGPQATRAVPARARPGRPSSGARERILEACLEVLKSDGYAGLSIAKIASRAGENKALVSYHYGSKHGAVAAAGRELGRTITADVLDGLEGASTVAEIVGGSVDGVWRVLDRDERLARVYFDLNAVSVVEDDVRAVMREVKSNWREVLARLLREADDGLSAKPARIAAVLVIAGIEGLCLERIERGETAELRAARALFIAATVAAIQNPSR